MSYKANDLLMPGVSRGRVRTASRVRGADMSLRKRRQWFAEDDNADADDSDSSGTDEDEGGSEDDADDSSNEPELLRQLKEGKISADDVYSLITGLRTEAAAGRQAKKQLTETQKAQEEAAQKEAEEQGEFKKLWDDAQPKLKRLEELEAADAERREELSAQTEKRIKELPKDKRKVAESVLDKIGDDPYKRAAALDDLLPTLAATPNPPGMDGGTKGDGKDASKKKPTLGKASY